MPDKWEYPWFAAWDLAFHCVALAHVDPAFAKYQLRLLCREWFQHPNGALPAYEWDFGDVNPPVQAWAALEVFVIDGCRDLDFLSQVFDKLLVNFTWWVNREDAAGSNLFEGGFLGLDNIGPLDRSHLPVGGRLQQSDATGWMASYALAMAAIALFLHRGGRPAADLVLKFLEHFAAIRSAIGEQGLWNDRDGLFYDRLVDPGRDVGARRGPVDGRHHPDAGRRGHRRADARPCRAVRQELRRACWPGRASTIARSWPRPGCCAAGPGSAGCCSVWSGSTGSSGCSGSCSTKDEFLSPHGLRAMSAYHREHPYELVVESVRASIDYEPAESTTDMFGGNSNWRGPLWFPLNHLVIRRAGALPPVLRRRVHRRVPDRVGQPAAAGRGGRGPARAPVVDLHGRARTGGGPASAASSGCRPTRPGRTTSSSASTSTATTARASARRTRPGGPGSWPT